MTGSAGLGVRSSSAVARAAGSLLTATRVRPQARADSKQTA